MAKNKALPNPKKTLTSVIAPRNDSGKCHYSEWCIECYEHSFSNASNTKMYNC